ncbi:MAG: GDSL-type esterase/lipase family protein [Phycisphaerae bacterium]
MSRLHSNLTARLLFAGIITLLAPLAACGAPTRVACVGDSITWGVGIPNPAINAWPGQLQKMLGKHYKVEDFGDPGATLLYDGNLPYYKTPQYKFSTAFKAKIVIIMLGTNDTKAINWRHHAHFVHDLIKLVKHYQSCTSNVKVWLCLPPQVLNTTWIRSQPNMAINEKNMAGGVIPAIKIVAAKLHLPIINVHDGMHDDKSLLQADGIHPNVKGQHVVAKIIYRALMKN